MYYIPRNYILIKLRIRAIPPIKLTRDNNELSRVMPPLGHQTALKQYETSHSGNFCNTARFQVRCLQSYAHQVNALILGPCHA